jgi:hypothetical protein
MADEEFRTIFHAQSLLEAENVKGILIAAGIPARVSGSLSTEPVVTSREVQGDVRVVAPADRAHEARTVLENARDQGRKLEGWMAENPDQTDAP